MYLIVSQDDLTKLKSETVADLLSRLRPRVHAAAGSIVRVPEKPNAVVAADTELDYEDVVDLTSNQVADLVDGINEKSVDGLRLLAELGPIIDAELLLAEGIEDLGRFQAGITRRTRTITGNKSARLLAFDEWAWDDETSTLSGHYAVTEATYLALKEVFSL